LRRIGQQLHMIDPQALNVAMHLRRIAIDLIEDAAHFLHLEMGLELRIQSRHELPGVVCRAPRANRRRNLVEQATQCGVFPFDLDDRSFAQI
jgi:hypothetical protein